MRDFQKDLELVRTFCVEHRIGFGAEDKEDDDESKYTIAYEVDNTTIFLFLVEDETEETDQVVLDTIVIKIYDDLDICGVLMGKCVAHQLM